MIIFSKEQEAAIELCTDRSKRIVCVTGQAGSGKTTLLKKAFDDLIEENCQGMTEDEIAEYVYLCAPTGRAANRIEEATGHPAMTIHRAMKFSVPEDDKDFGLPAHNKANPLPCMVLFIDEASMLESDLRRQVIDALKAGACIRFFGDVNQLPPIRGLSPFAIDLEKFPSATLTKNYRSEDGIISVADGIIRNRMPISNDKVSVIRVKKGQALDQIMKLAEEIDFTRMENQIITQTKMTVAGTEKINVQIQQRFNPNKEKITIFQSIQGETIVRNFKRGDKVLWDKNNYDLDLMNGTIGTVLDFDEETGSIAVHMNNRDIEIPNQLLRKDPKTGEMRPYDPRHALLLAYAITTHKAQGSQFNLVMFSCSSSRINTRQNIYTAVTRAENSLIILNQAGALNSGLGNVAQLK